MSDLGGQYAERVTQDRTLTPSDGDLIRGLLRKDEPWWVQEGCLAGRQLEGGLWMIVRQMLFTFRVAVCTPEQMLEFYCYKDLVTAVDAYKAWDGGPENPVPGWTRHHR